MSGIHYFQETAPLWTCGIWVDGSVYPRTRDYRNLMWSPLISYDIWTQTLNSLSFWETRYNGRLFSLFIPIVPRRTFHNWVSFRHFSLIVGYLWLCISFIQLVDERLIIIQPLTSYVSTVRCFVHWGLIPIDIYKLLYKTVSRLLKTRMSLHCFQVIQRLLLSKTWQADGRWFP